MIGLPEFGQRVKVWPMPGRKVQDGARPVDHLGGGRWLNMEGREVIWTVFHLEQYRAGDLLLHAPLEEQPKAPEERKPFDPVEAAEAHMAAMRKPEEA